MMHRGEPARARDDPQRCMFAAALVEAAKEVLALAKQKRLTIVTAESCTSGLLATALAVMRRAAQR